MSNAPDTSIASLGGETMGTTWSVKLVASPQADLHVLHAVIQSELDRVVAQMSTWETDSDISRFNRLAADSWQVLPPEFFDVLACALQIATASDGAYDPTVGPLVEAWGFGASAGARQVPETETLRAALARVGWQRIQLQTERMRALQAGGLQLDLSAIAKGYGVECVARCLRARGIDSALVEVGGELHGSGRKPDGSEWQVLVESSPDEDTENTLPPRVIALEDRAIATSGDHWHAFEQDGIRYSHTLDPRTGYPVRHAPAAVTVIADHAMHADAWATALTVMGADAGFAFAQHKQLAARFMLQRDGQWVERMTDAFQALLPA
jgi:thiamine biosynthesis lipoprotein